MSNIFYIIDDEKVIIATLKQLLLKAFPSSEVIDFEDASSAWKKLDKETRPIIIVSDQNMPGITGVQLLKKIRTHETLKDSVFIVMSDHHSRDENLSFLREGADDYLAKPFEIDQIIAKLRNASRIVDFRIEKNKLDEEIKKLKAEMDAESRKQMDLIKKFMEIRLPEYSAEIPRIKDASISIAAILAKDKVEIEKIANASEIAHAARIFLPEKSLTKPIMISGMVQNDDMKLIPEYFDMLTSNIRNFKEEAAILRHIYENYDGTGMPEHIKSWKVPLGSRILRVAIDFEEQMKKQKDNASKAIEALFHEGKRLYDYRVVAYYDQYLASKNLGSKAGFSGVETPYEIKELESGMTVSRNIITDTGLILIAAGTQLNDEKIERVRSITKTDPIIGRIYIKEK